MDDLRSCPIPHPDLISRPVEDELVIVRPVDGQIRVLNSVGALIWRSMDGERTLKELAELVCDEYEVSISEAKEDIQSFLDPFVENGLVLWADREGR